MSMKMEELLQLIDAVSESDLTELEYKDENAEISLKKKLQPIQSGQQIEEVSCTEEIVQQKAALNKNEADGPEQKKGKIVTAPLVGTFYAAPAEDEEPFVKVGERVEKGQIVAIIEAMKLMNEIESDFAGTVTEVFVENGQSVEYGQPLFAVGYKDEQVHNESIVRKHIAIEILLNLIIGKSSKLYKELYETGIIMEEPDKSFEFSKQYAHAIISGQTKDPKIVAEKIKETVQNYKENGIPDEEFERIKKKIYGEYVMEYNQISNIARMFLADYMKKINSFDYLEEYKLVTREYAQQILKETFKDENMAVAVIKGE